MLHDNDLDTKIDRLTAPLRDATLTRHLGALKARVGEPLDTFLSAFATGHVLGMLGAHYLLRDVANVPLPQLDEEACSSRIAFLFPAVVIGMHLHAIKTTRQPEPEVFREMESGCAALSDRACVLAYDGHVYLTPTDETVLPRLFDLIAFAYATGVALAREAAGEPPTEALSGVLAAVRRIPTHQRALLEARYAAGASVTTVARQRNWKENKALQKIADALVSVEAEARQCGRGVGLS